VPDITIRRATDDDLGRIERLLDASRRELDNTPSTQYLLDALDRGDSGSNSMVEDHRSTVLLGAFAGADCGIAIARLVRRDDGSAVVTVPWIYVEAGFRRNGVAEAMVLELRGLLARSGGGVLDVLAAPGDRATKSLLEVSGMKARAIVMSRTVPSIEQSDPAG
jgi:ribosomal protein S18 acetylase RimI-like enzyme